MRQAVKAIMGGAALLIVLSAPSCGTARDPCAGLPLSPTPSVTLRPRFEHLGLTAKDQSPRGCCSLFALCGALEYEWAQTSGATQPVRLSEEYLNWASHQTNGRRTDGSFFADALRGLATFGVCREDLLPYGRGFQPEAEPPAAAHADAEGRRDVRALWIKPWDATTGMTGEMLAEVRRELSDGHPVAIGLRWPHEEAYSAEGLLEVPPPEGVFDGHSVLLVGWQEAVTAPGGGFFIFRNSFGPRWREGGYGRMPYAYAQAYGNDALTLRLGGGVPLPSNRVARAPIEFETMAVEETLGCIPAKQSMAAWGAARWSGGAHLFCAAEPGARLLFTLQPAAPGAYRIALFATRAQDFGIVRIVLDERRLGDDIDLYARAVGPTGRMALGATELTAGPHRLRVEVVGRNPAAAGSFFGLDCLELAPLSAPGP